MRSSHRTSFGTLSFNKADKQVQPRGVLVAQWVKHPTGVFASDLDITQGIRHFCKVADIYLKAPDVTYLAPQGEGASYTVPDVEWKTTGRNDRPPASNENPALRE